MHGVSTEYSVRYHRAPTAVGVRSPRGTHTSMMKNRFVPLAAAVALAGCAGSTPAPSPAPSTSPATQQSPAQRPAGTAGATGQDTTARGGAGGPGAAAP